MTALLLASPPASPPATPEVPFALFVQRSSTRGAAVWRVHADGRTERLPGAYPEAAGEALWTGTTFPVPSPDQRRLAFLDAGQIHVRDLDSDQEHAVTHLEDPRSGARLSITAWSPDGGSLLYHVAAPLGPSGDADHAPVAFRVHDLASGEDRALDVPARHGVLAWLRDGSFLVEDLTPGAHAWGKWKPGADAVEIVRPPPVQCGRFAVQGARLLASCWDADSGPSRILSIPLSGGPAEPVSPPFAWGGCSAPSVSPDGGRLAYVQTRRSGSGEPGRDPSRLIVDGKPVFACAGLRSGNYVWIGDEAVALLCGDELLVVDPDDGGVRSRTALPSL